MSGDSRFLGFWYVLPYLVGLLVFTAVPFVASFWLSFTDYRLMQGAEFVGLRNYADLLQDPRYLNSLQATLRFSLVSVLVELVLGVAIATVLNQEFRGRGFVRGLMILPWAMPSIVNAAPVIWDAASVHKKTASCATCST